MSALDFQLHTLIDTRYACAYGLGVLKQKRIRHYGEYRTGRLVLTAWDRMEAGGEFAAMDM